MLFSSIHLWSGRWRESVGATVGSCSFNEHENSEKKNISLRSDLLCRMNTRQQQKPKRGNKIVKTNTKLNLVFSLSTTRHLTHSPHPLHCCSTNAKQPCTGFKSCSCTQKCFSPMKHTFSVGFDWSWACRTNLLTDWSHLCYPPHYPSIPIHITEKIHLNFFFSSLSSQSHCKVMHREILPKILPDG